MAVRTVADIDVKMVNARITGSPTGMVTVFFPKREEERNAPGEPGRATGKLVEKLEEII